MNFMAGFDCYERAPARRVTNPQATRPRLSAGARRGAVRAAMSPDTFAFNNLTNCTHSPPGAPPPTTSAPP